MTGTSDQQFLAELIEAMTQPIDPGDLASNRLGCFIIPMDEEIRRRLLEDRRLYIPKELPHGTSPAQPGAAERH